MEREAYSSSEAVKALHGKLFFRKAVLAFLQFLVVLCFSTGFFVIILRKIECFSTETVLYWIIPGLVFAVLYGIIYARQHDTSEKDCIAAIDAENSAGGLLMAENELSDVSWEFARTNRFHIPEVKTDYSKKLGLCLLALAFTVSCCFVPLIGIADVDRKINLTNKIEEIKEKVELLEKEEIITPEEKKQLELALENIEENSDKNAPGITFEALDHVNEKLCHEAASEMKKRISDNDLLKKLENFAKEAKNSEEARNGKANELLDQLKNILRQSGMNEDQINDFLKQQFGGSSADDGITQNQIEKYADQLGEQSKEKLEEAAQLARKMANQKLIPSELADQLSKEAAKGNTGNSDNQGQNGNQNGGQTGNESCLVAVPQASENGGQSENGSSAQNGDGKSKNGSGENTSEGNSNSDTSGTGGVGKGPAAPTPLTFGEKASDYNARFHDEVLPETKKESVSGAVSVGIGVSAPKVGNETSEKNYIEINNGKAVDSKSSAQIVLPKYRNTVKNYFSE